MAKQQRPWLIAYHVGVTVLTLWSVVNVTLMFLKWGDYAIEFAIANGLLVVFAVDYLFSPKYLYLCTKK